MLGLWKMCVWPFGLLAFWNIRPKSRGTLGPLSHWTFGAKNRGTNSRCFNGSSLALNSVSVSLRKPAAKASASSAFMGIPKYQSMPTVVSRMLRCCEAPTVPAPHAILVQSITRSDSLQFTAFLPLIPKAGNILMTTISLYPSQCIGTATLRMRTWQTIGKGWLGIAFVRA